MAVGLFHVCLLAIRGVVRAFHRKALAPTGLLEHSGAFFNCLGV